MEHRAEDAVDLDTARRLLEQVPPYVGRYAVTHTTELHDLLNLVKLPLDTIQLHGDTSVTTVEKFRGLAPYIRLLKAIHVSDQVELESTTEWESLVDGFVLDSTNPLEDRIGGTGLTHNWSVSATIVRDCRSPVILAGGLRPDNVGDAVRAVHPWGINVNSGVEQDAAKDRELIRDFIRQANAVLGPWR